MKKIISILCLIGATTFVVSAETTAVATTTPAVVASTVSAGLTPESSFYFFDKITESLQELFAFSPDAKVKLQLAFAAERVAEAKAMLANPGDHKKGLEEVNASIVQNIQKTSEVLKSEKSKGNDISSLAKEANDQFDDEESDLNKTLAESHKEIVDTKIVETKKLLEEAKATKDEVKITDAEKNLELAKQNAEDLKTQKEEIKKSFQDEKRSIEEEMSKDDQEEDKINHENEDVNDTEDSESDLGDDSQKENTEVKNEDNNGTSTESRKLNDKED